MKRKDCDDVVIMDSGTITVQGDPEALRKNLGDKMLWISSPDPSLLAQRIHTEFGFEASEVDGSICIKRSAPGQAIPPL